MSSCRRLAAVAGVTAVAAAPGGSRADVVGPFQFTIDRPTSRLVANASCSVSAPTGTAIGTYDPAVDPGGTRTRPGLDGPFGPTNNEAVPLTFAGELGDHIEQLVAGGFQMSLSPDAQSAQVSGLSANLLTSGPPSFGASVLFYTADGFRTRSPDLDYPGGSPLQLPLVVATLTSLSVSQEGAASGTASPGPGPGQWSFSVVTMVNLSATFTYLGNSFSAPAQAPMPLALAGVMTVSGNSATLTSVAPADLSNSVNQQTNLARFPFDLTQVSTPDLTAHLLLDLVVSNVTASIGGELTLNAEGVLVPPPGAAGVLVLGMGMASRRQRRR